MGKRGPKPKSTALRILEGNPSKRPFNDLEPACEMPAVKPSVIAADELASLEWDRLTAAMPPGLYTAADVAVIATYCQAWALMIRAQKEIDENGVMFTIFEECEKTGEMMPVKTIVSPAVKVWKAASETLLKTADRLGLSPGVRSRLQLPQRGESPEQKSKFAGLMGRG